MDTSNKTVLCCFLVADAVKDNKTKPFIALAISIFSVSFAAIFIVSLPDVHPLVISLYRLAFTIVFLLPIALIKGGILSELRCLKKRDWAMMILIGFILAAHFACWVSSLKMTSVASSTILVTAHPVLVAPVALYFFKEKLSIVNVLGIIFSLIGAIILVGGNYGFGGGLDTLEGNILAILGGAAAGLYILGGRSIRCRNISVISYALPVYSIAAVTLFFVCLTTGVNVTQITFSELQIIIVMAFVAGILGHTLYNWSLGFIRASVASVVLLLEPIGSSILAYILPWINQTPSIYTLGGGTVILFGVYLTAKNTKDPDVI